MKILQVAFLLLFNYLDSLPKLYYIDLSDMLNRFHLQPLHSLWLISAIVLTLKVLVMTIDAQWKGMGDVGSAKCEPALLPPCPTIRVLSYSN